MSFQDEYLPDAEYIRTGIQEFATVKFRNVYFQP